MSATVSCPHCKGLIVADPSIAGRNVGCPHCNGRVIMPGAALSNPSPVIVVNQPNDNSDPLSFLESPSTSTASGTYNSPINVGSFSKSRSKKSAGMPKGLKIGLGIFVGLFILGLIGSAIDGGDAKAKFHDKAIGMTAPGVRGLANRMPSTTFEECRFGFM